MNSKVIIGIIVVVILIGGGVLLMNKGKGTPSSQNQTQMNMPSTSIAKPSTNSSAQQIAATNSVDIANFAYSPATIKIKVGDTVTWTNKDSVGHSATADDGTWDTGVLPQGKSGSEKFTKAGNFTYHCSVH